MEILTPASPRWEEFIEQLNAALSKLAVLAMPATTPIAMPKP